MMILFRLILALALVTVEVGGGHQYKDVQENQRSWDGLDVVMVCIMAGLSVVLIEQANAESLSMDSSKSNIKRSTAAVRTKRKRLRYARSMKPEFWRAQRYKRYQPVTSVALENTLNSTDSNGLKKDDCSSPDIFKTQASTTGINLNSSSLLENSSKAELHHRKQNSSEKKEPLFKPSALQRLAAYIAPVNLNDPRPRSWPWPKNINIWPVTSSSETVPTTDKHSPANATAKYSLPLSWPWPDVINVWPVTSPPEESAKEASSQPRDIILASTTERKRARRMHGQTEKNPTALVEDSSKTTKPNCKPSPLEVTNLNTYTTKPYLKPNHPTKSNVKITSATMPNAKLKLHEDSCTVRDERVELLKDCDIRPRVSNNSPRKTKLKPTAKVQSVIEAIIAAAKTKSPKEQVQYESKRNNISTEDKRIYHPLTNFKPASHFQKPTDTTSLKPKSQSQKWAARINPTLASQLQRRAAATNSKPASNSQRQVAISYSTPTPQSRGTAATTNPPAALLSLKCSAGHRSAPTNPTTNPSTPRENKPLLKDNPSKPIEVAKKKISQYSTKNQTMRLKPSASKVHQSLSLRSSKSARPVNKSTQIEVIFSSKSASRISLKAEKRSRKLLKSRGVFEDGQYKLKSIIPEPAAVPVTKAGTQKRSNINKMIEFYNKL